MEKRSNKNPIPVIIGIIIAVFFLMAVGVGMALIYFIKFDNGNFSVRNNLWVKKMNDTFPDDEFTYVCYDMFAVGGLGAFKNRNVIVVASKNIPDKRITVGWNENHTRIVTDYNYVRYKEKLSEYYKNVMSRYFFPDEMKAVYWIVFEEKTPVKDYSFDEYRESHSDVCKLTVYMKYDGDFPSEDEMTAAFDSYIDDLEDKAELTVYLSHTTLESDDTTEGNERYILSMDSPTKINYLNHSITHWTVTKSGKRSREDIRTVIYENRYVNR